MSTSTLKRSGSRVVAGIAALTLSTTGLVVLGMGAAAAAPMPRTTRPVVLRVSAAMPATTRLPERLRVLVLMATSQVEALEAGSAPGRRHARGGVPAPVRHGSPGSGAPQRCGPNLTRL